MIPFASSRPAVPDAGSPLAARGLVPHPPLHPRLRRRVECGRSLYRVGDALLALYVLRTGVFKSMAASDDRLGQVTGFHMAGDVMGLDGIGTGRHMSEAVALEDAEVFVLPMAECDRWTHESAHGQRLMARLMAGEITHAQTHMMMLGTMQAGQKIAAFLMEFSERHGRLGYSRSHFQLRMTRQDIASYLGLKIETVSRGLSRLQRDDLIAVSGRSVALVDLPGLSRLAGLAPDAVATLPVAILDREGRLLVS